MTIEEQAFREELWRQFNKKIEENWNEKYSSKFGANHKEIHLIEPLRGFAKAILAETKSKIKSKNGSLNILMIEDTLYNIFKNQTFKNAHYNTVQCFLYFLELSPDWEEFKTENKEKIDKILPEKNPNSTKALSYFDKFKKYKFLFLILSLLLISSLVIYKNWYRIFKDPQIPVFLKLIQKADSTEFASYKNLPLIDSTGLDIYFTSQGGAKKRVINILSEHQKRHLIINNDKNPSIFKIDESTCKILRKTPNEVQLEIEESWFILWYDSIKKRYHIKWDVNGKQKYFLKKVDNNWKVDFNPYEGTPQIMDY